MILVARKFTAGLKCDHLARSDGLTALNILLALVSALDALLDARRTAARSADTLTPAQLLRFAAQGTCSGARILHLP